MTFKNLQVKTIDTLFTDDLESGIEVIFQEAKKAIEEGASLFDSFRS